MIDIDTAALGRAPVRAGVPLLVTMAALVLVTVLALVAVGAPLLAVGAGMAGILLMALAFNPDLVTIAVVVLIYSNAAVLAVRVHGVPGFVGTAVPLLLLIPLANAVLAERRPVVMPSAMPWLLGFLLVHIASALLAADTETAWEGVTQFLFEGLTLFFVVANVVRTPQLLRRLVWILLIVGAGLGALSAHQTLTQNYDRDYFGFAQADTIAVQALTDELGLLRPPDDQPPRQGGPLGEPNRYAQIMAALLPLGLLQFTHQRSTVARLAAAGATALILMAIGFTFSRGAAVGIALSLVLAVLLRYVRLREVVVLAVAFGVLLLAVPSYSARLSTIATVPGVFTKDTSSGVADNAIRGRLGEAAAGLGILADHPLLGVGPNLYALNYRDYAKKSGFRVRLGPRQAHNLPLDIASETGILGLGCFLGAVAVTLRDLGRARRRLLADDPEVASLVTSMALAIVVYLSTSLFLQLSYVRYFWLWLALGAAASTLASPAARERPAEVAAATST